MEKVKISYLKIIGHNPKWRCSLLILSKGSTVAHLVAEGWGDTKSQALEYAIAEAGNYYYMTKREAIKNLKRLAKR